MANCRAVHKRTVNKLYRILTTCSAMTQQHEKDSLEGRDRHYTCNIISIKSNEEIQDHYFI